jgi:hypothetical protein
VALMACSSGSISQQTGYPASGGGPLGATAGSDDASTGSPTQTPVPTPTGAEGDDASSAASEAGSSTGGGGGASAASDAGSSDAATGDGAVAAVTFTLLNATVTNVVQGSPVPGYDPIPPGSTISLGAVGTSLSIRANTTPATVGSVEFILDANYTHTENATPYTLCGDNGQGTITPCAQLAAGQHTLIATEFTQANLGGTNEGTATISFTITP